MKIEYVEKETIYPRFGMAVNGIAYVRKDLPECVRDFVEIHELYHLQDMETRWIVREIKANIAGAAKHPWGFIVCAIMSLAPYRLAYYVTRFLRGE